MAKARAKYSVSGRKPEIVIKKSPGPPPLFSLLSTGDGVGSVLQQIPLDTTIPGFVASTFPPVTAPDWVKFLTSRVETEICSGVFLQAMTNNRRQIQTKNETRI